MKVVDFIRNRWFRVVLSTALIVWTVISLQWIWDAKAPWWIIGHVLYDMVIEIILAVSLWADVIWKRAHPKKEGE